MSTANWVHEPDLNSYLENYNFNLHPITLEFESDYGAVVKAINGKLPDGLKWTQVGRTVVIEGVSTGVSVNEYSNITLRITDPDGTIADRTFYIEITPFGLAPSWSGQDSFIGYATFGVSATYRVTASISNTTPIVYRILNAPSGMSIDSKTGVITYIPPTSLLPFGAPTPYDVTVSFSVRATSGSTYEDLPATVTVLTANHAPAWITVAGLIGTFAADDFMELSVSAYDAGANAITYTLVNPPAGFPFALSPTGFMYGTTPVYPDATYVVFTIAATSVNGSTQRTFNVLISPDTASGLLSWTNASAVLGTFVDGQTVVIDVSAVSTRPNTVVNHRFVGGSLPPNLNMNNSQGKIAGFLEYHPQPRDYFFEIEANDGYQTISRRYQVSVAKGTNDQFLDVSLPVMADVKQALIDTRQAMFDNPSVIVNSNTLRDSAATEVSLIRGLRYSNDDPDAVFTASNLYLHSTTLGFGTSSSANVKVDTEIVFTRNVIDPLAGSAYLINNDLPYTVYPPSLANMRKSLSIANGYSNDGRGSDAKLLPVMDYENTAIKSVTVVDGGSGYYFAPSLQALGTGNGAVMTCTITVKSANVLNSDAGWTQGETIRLLVDRYLAVTMTASSVDALGKLSAVTIDDGGSFTLFPTGNKTVYSSNGTTAELDFNLGIDAVTVVAGGVGYADQGTVISVYGKEVLESWETAWSPYVYVNTVTAGGLSAVLKNTTAATLNILGSKSWKVQHLLMTMQGKTWTGNTLFDNDICSFDGDQTRFTEWLEPLDTVFELDNTYFDHRGTRFDDNLEFQNVAYRMWGGTIFDSEITVFDLYNTMFDEAGPTYRSITEITKLYRMQSQQISGHNQVT